MEQGKEYHINNSTIKVIDRLMALDTIKLVKKLGFEIVKE